MVLEESRTTGSRDSYYRRFLRITPDSIDPTAGGYPQDLPVSTVNRRQLGKVPTPFCWFGQGLTVKDPLSLSEDEDEQRTQVLPRFGPPGG